jgi:hypothetical protein
MLNNKYLAIVLSVIAVVAVVYQVFFNKTSTPAVNRARASEASRTPAFTPPPQPEPGALPQALATTSPQDNGEGPVIDADSPILLKRVYDEPLEKYPRQELPEEYGRDIFSAPPKTEYETTEDTEEPTDFRFRLNSILIDRGRRIAVINDTILFVGDTIAGARVVSIQDKRVLLKLRDKNIVLSNEPGIDSIKKSGGKGDI